MKITCLLIFALPLLLTGCAVDAHYGDGYRHSDSYYGHSHYRSNDYHNSYYRGSRSDRYRYY